MAARSILLTLAVAAVALTTSVTAVPARDWLPVDYSRVLAAEPRTAEDRERDAARHTAETLAFADVRPGQHVVDMIIGGGFFTRAFSAAVGPEGRVTAWQPAEFIAFQASYGEALEAADAIGNVDVIRSPIAQPEFPAGVDVIFTAQNYHDLHLEPFADDTARSVNQAAFAALRPGGVYVIIDHHGSVGSGLSEANSLHRIDREAVIAEVTAAGFVLDGESDVLRDPEDPRTANVFDAAIRGRTDQFMLRFRKPD